MPHEPVNWDERYTTRNTPWDSGVPSQELQRVLAEGWFGPCAMLEIGCGTGTNAIWLAQQGFQVTALDVSAVAIAQARPKAEAAGVCVRFEIADVLKVPEVGGPFAFVFDRGVYHHLRSVDLAAFQRALQRYTRRGSYYLSLAGNANDPDPPENGPPTVRAEEILAELGPLFDIVQLREFHFHGVVIGGKPVKPLGWSILLRRR
jgi:SAM-dependent methyltransferase